MLFFNSICKEVLSYGRLQQRKWNSTLLCNWLKYELNWATSQIAKFMGPTWGPPESCRPQVGPMLAPWTLLSGWASSSSFAFDNVHLHNTKRLRPVIFPTKGQKSGKCFHVIPSPCVFEMLTYTTAKRTSDGVYSMWASHPVGPINGGSIPFGYINVNMAFKHDLSNDVNSHKCGLLIFSACYIMPWRHFPNQWSHWSPVDNNSGFQ